MMKFYFKIYKFLPIITELLNLNSVYEGPSREIFYDRSLGFQVMGILSFDSVSKKQIFFYQCRKQKCSTYYVENKCRKQEFSTYYVENKNFLHSMQKTRIFYIVCRKFLFSTLVNHEKYKFLCGKLKMSVGKIFPTINVARIVIEKGTKKCRKMNLVRLGAITVIVIQLPITIAITCNQ